LGLRRAAFEEQNPYEKEQNSSNDNTSESDFFGIMEVKMRRHV
jgi:hypothetical protein